MKKIIIISLLFITTVNLFGQDREPSAWEFKLDTNKPKQVFNPNDFNQHQYNFGFQWGASKNMIDSLGCNSYANNKYLIQFNDSAKPLSYIVQPVWMNATAYHPGYWHCVFMNYEPALPLDSSNFGQILRPNDPSDPIFGFTKRVGTIINNPADENYSRLIVTKDLADTGAVTILKNMMPQPRFKSYNIKSVGQLFDGQQDMYHGKKWYLTVNLRRLDPLADNEVDSTAVLKIKLKYIKWNGNESYMVFDTIPMQGLSNIDTLNYKEFRGYAQKMDTDSSMITDFLIRRNMLPVDPDNPDITVSASFCNKKAPENFENPMFSEKSEFLNQIKSIDIEVDYLGHTDLAIDYVRIESINSHYLLRGAYDSIPPWNPKDTNGRGFCRILTNPDDPTLKEYPNDLYYLLQSFLDSLVSQSGNWRLGKLHRFYFQDIETDKFYWWGTLRYANLLSNGMFTTRDVHQFADIHKYYTKTNVRWIGEPFSHCDDHMVAPYARYALGDWASFGLHWGFIGSSYDNKFTIEYRDSLNSNFETALKESKDTWNRVSDDNYYFETLLTSTRSTQMAWENKLYQTFYNPTKRKSDLIYSDLPWYDYFLFYHMEFQDSNLMVIYYRPKTAEELRLYMWSNVIRGCKGMYFDGDRDVSCPNIGPGQMGLGNDSLLLTNDLYSSNVGSDFIDDWNTWKILPNYAKLDTLSKMMGVGIFRVYIGTKSIRTELRKMNKWISANEDLLLDLRLAASYSKGYRAWYNQDTKRFGEQNLLARYIEIGNAQSTNRIKSRKIWNPIAQIFDAPYESFDSTFVDISLMRQKDDTTLNSSKLYIGVQNRRSDPLVYTYNTYLSADSSLQFYSAAEYDIFTKDGGNLISGDFRPASYWRDLWWKRLGCREITIPIKNRVKPGHHLIVKVKEVGTGTELDDEWWRKDGYLDIVDTAYAFSETDNTPQNIVVKMLPGEGKLLEVTYQYSNLSADLAYSNQHKIVQYPTEFDSEGKPTKVKYHSTYYHYNNSPGNFNVFYRRSVESDPDLPFTAISWEDEVNISLNLDAKILEQFPDINNLVCDVMYSEKFTESKNN